MALSDSIWWTRKARIQTEKRLLASAFQAQLLLLWYSFFSAGAAVYYLQFNPHSQYSAVAWVVFSILILSLSGFINGQRYKERAALVKDSYEALNGLYQRAKDSSSDNDAILTEYEQILSVCENHTEIDYQLALWHTYLSHNDPSDATSGLDRTPTRFTWLLVVKYYAAKFSALSGFYLLPIILFLLMEYQGVR